MDLLFDLVEKQPDIGQMKISICDVPTHEIKEIELKIKKLEKVQIPRPHYSKSKKNFPGYQPVFINVVRAYNETYSWTLLTNLPVDTFEACREIAEIYKARWHIEDYHKILKTGYQIDELYLHSSRDAIENALTMASLSALRLYWLIYIGRVDKDMKADRVFEEYEWKSLYVYFKEEIPTEPPMLNEVIIKIARLGGYKINKNAGPPGVKVMWLRFQSFNVAAEMFKNFMSSKT